MSMICGALKWLCDNEQREKERVEKILSGTQATELSNESARPNKSAAAGTHVLISATCIAAIRLLPIEPDWFTAFDEQKAQKEGAYRLKVSAHYIAMHAARS